MITLQDRIAEIMAAMKWEHADLMRVSGQSSSVVSQWRGVGRGKIIRSIGKLEAAEAIERATGFSALWVAKGMGPKRVHASCPRFWPRDSTGSPCISRGAYDGPNDARDYRDAPKLTVPYSAMVDLHNGVVEGVRMTTERVNFDKLLMLLVERYGQPTTKEVLPVTTSGGARLNARAWTWQGQSVAVHALEMPVRIDESVVVFSHLPTAASKKELQRSSTKDAAGRL